MKKKVLLLIILLIIFIAFSTIVCANPIDAMKGYESSSGNGVLNTAGSKIYGIIMIVGATVALGGLSIMGAKFMMAAPEEKAEVKKNLVGFTVGVIILICAVSLLTIFQKIGQEISAQASISYSNNLYLG